MTLSNAVLEALRSAGATEELIAAALTLPAALRAIVEALRSAGASEEIIAAAIKADGDERTLQRAKWTAN
jgi:hypothetical protein